MNRTEIKSCSQERLTLGFPHHMVFVINDIHDHIEIGCHDFTPESGTS